MIRTYYTNIDNISISELNLSKISPERQQAIRGFMQENRKKQCLGAGLLLCKLFPGKEVKTGEYGKPYIENGAQFNIAHSGSYVVISVGGDMPVGCDIEMLKDMKYERLAKTAFHKNELTALKNSDNQQELFFELWTKKEAFLKCVGAGFHLSSKKIDLTRNKHFLSYNNQRYRFKEYMLKGYKIMLCSPSTDFSKELKEINF